MELLDEERERLARENGPDLEYVGLLKRYSADPEGAQLRPRLQQSWHCVCMWNETLDLLVHGDDFMVEMPTHEEKWFEGVSFSKCDGKCTEKFHSDGTHRDGNFVLEPCDQMGSRIWQSRVGG